MVTRLIPNNARRAWARDRGLYLQAFLSRIKFFTAEPRSPQSSIAETKNDLSHHRDTEAPEKDGFFVWRGADRQIKSLSPFEAAAHCMQIIFLKGVAF